MVVESDISETCTLLLEVNESSSYNFDCVMELVSENLYLIFCFSDHANSFIRDCSFSYPYIHISYSEFPLLFPVSSTLYF